MKALSRPLTCISPIECVVAAMACPSTPSRRCAVAAMRAGDVYFNAVPATRGRGEGVPVASIPRQRRIVDVTVLGG